MKSLIDISISRGGAKGKSRFNELEMVDIFHQDIEIDDPEQRMAGKEGNQETFFDVLLDYCFFENDDEPAKVAAGVLKP